MSRLGKKPIPLPKDIKIQINKCAIAVEGAKGKLNLNISERIKIENKDNQLLLTRATNTKIDKSLHGLYRALILNMIKGVSEGFSRELEIVGVGYKAQVQNNNLVIQLGFTHPVNVSAPEGIKFETPKPTQIVIRGIDKQKVGKAAAEIRAINPPEPYKGTGIRYAGEQIRRKVGKAQATSK